MSDKIPVLLGSQIPQGGSGGIPGPEGPPGPAGPEGPPGPAADLTEVNSKLADLESRLAALEGAGG
jgi:hypothetical protein